MKKLLFSSFIMAMAIAILALCANAFAGTMIAANDEAIQQVAIATAADPAICNVAIQAAGAVSDEVCYLADMKKTMPLPVARSPDSLPDFLEFGKNVTNICRLAAPTARSPDSPIFGIGMEMMKTNPV